jgi:glycerophosphoryl diester phosphodiesterase
MAAFELARDLGADAVEFDVHSTSDGALVVHHDYLLDRTTSGTGLIHEHSLHQVKRIDAGSWFGPQYADQRVPDLDQVLCLGGLEFELELKGFTRAHMLGVVEQVRAHGVLDRTEFTSWHLPMLLALQHACPGARLGLFTRRREPWMPPEIFEHLVLCATEFATFDVVHVYAGDIDANLVAKIHDRGMIAHANDAADHDQMQRALDAGVDRLSTDDVELAITLARPQ